jgi:hypothetical protein
MDPPEASRGNNLTSHLVFWSKAGMDLAPAVEQTKSRDRSLAPLRDEPMRRQRAATQAQTHGSGGSSALSDAAGMSRSAIRKGIAGLEVRKTRPKAAVQTRLRREGAGRRRLTATDPGVAAGAGAAGGADEPGRSDARAPRAWPLD